MNNKARRIAFVIGIVVLIGMIMGLTGCKKQTVEKPIVEEPVKIEEPTAQPKEAETLSQLALGTVPENKFSIGTDGDKIALHLGTPEAEDWFAGHYLQYGNVIYFTDGIDAEQRGKLSAIDFGKDEIVYGQKVGNTVEAIKLAFGKVNETGWMDAESELYSGQWYMTYIRGDYVLTVYADNEKGISTNMRVELRR